MSFYKNEQHVSPWAQLLKSFSLWHLYTFEDLTSRLWDVKKREIYYFAMSLYFQMSHFLTARVRMMDRLKTARFLSARFLKSRLADWKTIQNLKRRLKTHTANKDTSLPGGRILSSLIIFKPLPVNLISSVFQPQPHTNNLGSYPEGHFF